MVFYVKAWSKEALPVQVIGYINNHALKALVSPSVEHGSLQEPTRLVV